MDTILSEVVAKHNTTESCWVVLYNNVYDVTDFLPSHPGGAKAILRLAGKDATAEYDPIHPPGTLEEHLPPEKTLGTVDPKSRPQPVILSPDSGKALHPSPEHLLNIRELETAATKLLSKKAWAYYYSASDDLISKSLNNAVYQQILLRPRVFVDCTRCDTGTSILGHASALPIFVSPAAMGRLAHPDGEHGIATACRKYGVIQIISHSASMTPEQIVQGAPPDQVFGWQIYVQDNRLKSENTLRRINKLPNIKFIVLTLDAPVPGKREDDERTSQPSSDQLVQSAFQEEGRGNNPESKAGGVGRALFAGTATDLTWKTTLPWLTRHTQLPIVLKGIQTHEDAHLASKHMPQVQGIILSNHGGRALDTAPPAIHTLLEIRKYCPSVLRKMDVLVDGGVKRGTDVVKALCLGAKAVGIGRPPLFGLALGGSVGVEQVMQIFKEEVETCMRLLGAESVKALGLQHVNTRAVERDIYDGPARASGVRGLLSRL